MRERKFIGRFDLSRDEITINDKQIVHQISDVLRLEVGDELVLCDGKMNEAECIIEIVDKASVRLHVLQRYVNKRESKRQVALYCAILKRDNFELVAQKATEIGVAEIVPLVSERTVKRSLKFDRIRTIIKEAAEQSGRGVIPDLRPQMILGEALADAHENNINFFLDENADEQITNNINAGVERIGVFVGPEGGWSGNEKDMIGSETGRHAKMKVVNMGPLTLRAETAAIVGTYLAAR